MEASGALIGEDKGRKIQKEGGRKKPSFQNILKYVIGSMLIRFIYIQSESH